MTDAASAATLWRHPNFLKLWAAQTVSMIGSQVTFLALPLTAILVLEAAPTQLGVLTALGAAPALLAGLHAGALVDRLRRRPILIATDLGRAAVLAIVPLAWAADRLSIGLLYAVALAVGLLGLFFDIAHHAFLPAIVARERLVDGNAKLALGGTAAEVAGPGLAGWLVAALSAPVALAVDALSYFGSALLLLGVRVAEPRPHRATAAPRLGSDIRDGLRVVFGDPRLRALAGARAVLNLFNAVLEAVLVLYVVRSLGLGPALIGAVFSVGSAGVLVGSLLPDRLARRLGLGRTMVLALVLVGASDLLVPLAGRAPAAALPLLVAAQFCFGLGITVFNIHQVSLRQAVVPAHLQGRATATFRVLNAGFISAGALLGGLLGQTIGLGQTLLLAAAGELIAAFWVWRSPLRGLRDLPDPGPA